MTVRSVCNMLQGGGELSAEIWVELFQCMCVCVCVLAQQQRGGSVLVSGFLLILA